jgi:hypothetical protein
MRYAQPGRWDCGRVGKAVSAAFTYSPSAFRGRAAGSFMRRSASILALASEPLWPPACPKGVGKLVDGENAFRVEFFALLRGHVRQQAEIISFLRLPPASSLKFALRAVRVQHLEANRHLAAFKFFISGESATS